MSIIKEIKCQNPRFVLNPSLLHLLTIHRKYSLNGEVRSVTNHQLTKWKYEGLSFFNFFRNSISYDTINNFGVIDKDSGELLPVFMAVPCGKCKCCKYKKSLDWKVRCICESSTSICPPLFFTLTYDNEHLPKEGVKKKDIQDFMKRLRSRLEYKGLDTTNLRYFVVAEYGTNTMRPHYHGLFWNFPYFDRFIDKIDIIQDSWHNGFVMCSPAKDLSGAYCMKYMQKDNKHPVGSNETFFLSSRGTGGLGIRWLKDNFEFYRQYPSEKSIKVKSFDGSIKELPMPTYFQRKLYPSMCGLIPLQVRKSLELFLNYRYLASICSDYCFKKNIRIKHKSYDVEKIFNFFSEFGLIDENYDLGQVYNYFSFIHKDLRSNIDNNEFIKLNFKYYHELECTNADILLNFIGDLDSHLREIKEIIDIGKRHKQFVDMFVEKLPDIELDDYIYKIDNIMAKSLQKEIF